MPVWTVTSTEVGKGREEDGAQVAQNPRQPLGPSRSPSSNTPLPAHEGGPRVSRDPDQVVSATCAFSGSGSTCGSAHHLDSGQKRVEGMRTDLVKAQEVVASTASRWRGKEESRRAPLWPGPSSDSGAFCNRVGDIAGMCSGVASRERRVESRIVRCRRP